MEDKSSSNYRWIILGVSFIILGLTSTIFQSFSIFFVALLKEFRWSRSTTAGAFSLLLILLGVIGPFAGSAIDRIGQRRVFVLGSLVLGLGLVLSSLTRSWWQFYISYGVITAIGIGSTAWVTNATVIQSWFKEKRGLAMGVLSSGVGVGIFVYIPTIQYLINSTGWRMAYRVMALFIPLVVITLTIIFLKKPPRITPSTPQEQETHHTTTRDPLIVDLKWASRSWSLRQAILTKQFWTLGVCFFFGSLLGNSILAHHVAFFVDKGLESLFVSYIVGLIGIVSIGGRILWGTLSDRIGRELTYTLAMICCICGTVLLIAFPVFASTYFPYFYTIVFGVGYSGVVVLPSLITADFFEGRAYGSIFGTIFLLYSVGGAFGTWFCGFLHDRMGSYIPFFIIAIACALFACFSIWIAAPRKIKAVPGKKAPRSKRKSTS
jgi:MFS family permease